MKKKLFSLIMAMAMIASLGISAFASGGGSGSGGANVTGTGSRDGTVALTGAMALPSVKVTIPTSGKAILNPYKMKVAKAGDSTDASDADDAIDDQVLSTSYEIKNETLAPMKVGVKITATPSTGVELATKACTGKETTKSVFMFAEMMYTGTQVSDVASLEDKWTAPADVNDKCYPQIIASTEEKTNASFFTVPAATASAANYLYWTLRGNAATAPDEAWAATDKIDASVVFSFTPDVLTTISFASDSIDNVAVLETGKDNGNDVLFDALKDSDDNLRASMGTIVRIVPKEGSTSNGVITAVEIKDSTGTKVTATKVNANLYYFTVTPSSNPLTVKISGTAAVSS